MMMMDIWSVWCFLYHSSSLHSVVHAIPGGSDPREFLRGPTPTKVLKGRKKQASKQTHKHHKKRHHAFIMNHTAQDKCRSPPPPPPPSKSSVLTECSLCCCEHCVLMSKALLEGGEGRVIARPPVDRASPIRHELV